MRLITLLFLLFSQFGLFSQESIFNSIDSKQSGITFSNYITENDRINITMYDYLYNGAGVGIGDFNNDGLSDIFFAGNMSPDELYYNLGGMKFNNVTESAGINKDGWSTGVCILDINGDLYDDIYVLRSGPDNEFSSLENVLYVNQKDGTFKEEAAKYGLNLEGHHTQAAPLDIDLDGDLDLYIMGHPANFQHKVDFQEAVLNIKRGKVESDILLENIDGKYIDITRQAKIMEYGYGLGLAITDINLDGFPDIIVCNDFDEPDHIFVNQQNNTFLDKNLDYFKHTSNYSMGNDVGDINNDGLLDYISVDMAFESHERSKTNMASMNPDKFNARVQVGWGHQYMHNMLQLNTGMGSFQEIGQIANVSKTDWSWAPLFFDIDQDGFQDLFISNGYKRDTKNNDIGFRLDSIKEKKGGIDIEEFLALIPSVKIENFFFKNSGSLVFEDMRKEWGVDEKLNTNGAAYADLDNDGDLDLILNNVDTLASVYENQSRQKSNSFVVDLGNIRESEFTGLKFKMFTAEGIQTKEAYFIRGYCSSVEKKIIFYSPISVPFDSLLVTNAFGENWLLSDIKKNTIFQLEADFKGLIKSEQSTKKSSPLFEEVTEDYKIKIPYVENDYYDFDNESLIPHQMSTSGPCIEVADLDNDGLVDFVISGSANQLTNVYLQRKTGTFTSKFSTPFYTHQLSEDAGIVVFDVNNDSKKDMIITSGGYQFEHGDTLLENRLYIGNGIGQFGLVKNALPNEFLNSGKIVTQDIDNDGDLDVLICGPAEPKKYPYPGQTKIYINESGFFKNRTNQIAPELATIGMVNEVVFADFDGDKDEDLIVVGEWMNVEFFENKDGKFYLINDLVDLKGWWSTVKAEDIDKDGDIDFILGNAGMNNKFGASKIKPVEVYANDFDENGSLDIVIAKNKEGYQVPLRGKECSSGQMPFINTKFPTFAAFAHSDLEDIYGKEKLDSALHLVVNEFRSGILYNEGKNVFDFRPFSIEAQFSFLNSFEIVDLNNDGLLDIIGVGNRFNTEVETTRYDAGCGVVYLQNKEGGFDYLSPLESGFYVPHNAKTIKKILLGVQKDVGFLIGNNNQYVQLFKLNSN